MAAGDVNSDQATPLLGNIRYPTALPHYDFLDGVRAILALYVMAHHAWYTVFDYNGKSVSRYFSVLAHGHYAICFFMILSGYCLTLPTLRNGFSIVKGVRTFLKRRAWRILPPYYFALVLSLMLIGISIHKKTGTLWDTSIPVTHQGAVTHFLLIQNLVPGDILKINYVFWSISIEWQVYFFFPLLLLGWRLIGPISTTLAAILGSLVLEKGIDHYLPITPNANFLGLFALGMLAAQGSISRSAIPDNYKKVPWTLIATFTCARFVALDRLHHQLTADVMFGCFASALLFIASRNPSGWLHGLFSSKPLVFVGSFSYSIYLIHAPLLQVLWQYPFSTLQSHVNVMCIVLIVVGGPTIVLMAYVFHLCCERPFLRMRGGNVRS